MNKWIGISLGGLIGISHIGLIGMVARKSDFPVVNVPVGPYTSYSVTANKDGYSINYRANDPKTFRVERDLKRKSGVLGLGNDTTKVTEEFTHQQLQQLGSDINESPANVACIEAIGGGKQTGRLVGSGVGTALAPSVASIPVVGWVAAGFVTMFSGNQGAEIGGTMSRSLADECKD